MSRANTNGELHNDDIEYQSYDSSLYLKPERAQLEYELESKNSSEYHIEDVESIAILFVLTIILQTNLFDINIKSTNTDTYATSFCPSPLLIHY